MLVILPQHWPHSSFCLYYTCHLVLCTDPPWQESTECCPIRKKNRYHQIKKKSLICAFDWLYLHFFLVLPVLFCLLVYGILERSQNEKPIFFSKFLQRHIYIYKGLQCILINCPLYTPYRTRPRWIIKIPSSSNIWLRWMASWFLQIQFILCSISFVGIFISSFFLSRFGVDFS